jgi:glycosyltransferase involved in cell wall biosynthesis
MNAASSASPRLRILFVAPYVPSPIRVRPYQFIRHLARAGHEITLVALGGGAGASQGDRTAMAEMEQICRSVHVVPHARWRAAAQCALALPTPTPLWAAYCHSATMTRIVRDLVDSERFDVAHVEHLRAAHIAPALGTLPRVIDAVDCITALRRQMVENAGEQAPAGGSSGVGAAVSRLASRVFAWEEWTKLKRYEPRAYRAYAGVLVTSAHDADELERLVCPRCGGNRPAAPAAPLLPPIHVIPNGVDLDYFAADPVEASERDIEPDTLVFSGKMSYHANDDAARFLLTEVMPRLWQIRSGVRLTIVGSQPSSALRALAAAVAERHQKNPAAAIHVTGYVEDLRPYLRRAAVAVCPMRIGVGIQNKALEAMAVGRPVVCSPLVRRALSQAESVGALCVAQTADEFAGAIAAWLARPEAARQAGRAARRYVEEHHRWQGAA